MGDQRVRMSHSTVDTMLTCPKKYQLRKVVRVEERPSYAALGGKAVHEGSEAVERLLFPELFTSAQETPQGETHV